MNTYQNIAGTESPEGGSLVDIFRILFRWKTSMAVFFFPVFIITVVVTLFSPDIYRSEASLLLKPGRENLLIDPTASMGQTITVRQDKTTEINSEIQILKSRDLADITVTRLGISSFTEEKGILDKISSFFRETLFKPVIMLKERLLSWITPFPGNENDAILSREQKIKEGLIKKVMNNFSCEGITSSNIITLAYESRNPELAKQVLQELMLNYLDKHMSVHRTSGSYEFFNQQTQTLQTNLQKNGAQLKHLKNETGIASLPEQRSLLLQRIDALKSASGDVESKLAASQQKLLVLNTSLQKIPRTMVQTQRTGSPSSAVEELRKQIYILSLEEQELLSKFSPQSVPVKEIRRRIGSAKELLRKSEQPREITTGINSTYQQVEIDTMMEKRELTALQATAAELKSQLEMATNELKNLNDYEFQITGLERELEIDEAGYRKYSDVKEQTRIDNALELGKISNISVAQPCTLPVEPVRPKKALNMSFGLFFGLFGALGIAFFREYMSHTFTRPEDIEKRLGIPSLGSLPVMGSHQFMQIELNSENQFYLPNESVSFLTDGEENPPLQLIEADDFEELKPEDITAKIIAVTSSRKGEGVSSFSLYLGSMLRHHYDKKVLLIDTNFENPGLHVILNGQRSPGLGDILLWKKELAVSQPTAIPGLDFIPIGKKRSAHLTLSEKRLVGEFLHALKQEYDFIILDTPPLWNGAGPKATSFEPLADGVILVVEAEKMRWEIVKRTKLRLEMMHANVIGAVLNKRCYHIPKWLYQKL